NLEIPDSVTSLGIWTFKENELESIKLSKNLHEIPRFTFEKNNLKRIVIPVYVDKLGNNVFANNDLEEVIIENIDLEFDANVFAHDTDDPQDLVIKGYEGSTAETYAAMNDHTFDPFIEIPDENLKRAINGELGKTSTP